MQPGRASARLAAKEAAAGSFVDGDALATLLQVTIYLKVHNISLT